MATQGTEKYYRINLFLDKGCIKLTRALIQKHVDNYTLLCHTPSSWPLEDFIRHNQRSIFHFPNGKKRNNLMEEYKQLLVPLAPNKPNIDDWDLPLRCFVLREICDLSLLPQHKADIKVIKKIRNKLCHTTDPSLSDTEYVDYSQQLKDVIGRFLTWLKDANVAKEVYDIIKDIEDGPLTHLQTLVRQVEDWQKSDQAIAAAMNNLELKTTEGFAVQSENFKVIMEKTQQLLDLYTKGQPFQPPGTKITMNVLNCDTNTEDFLCSKLVDIFMKERAGNESEEQLPRLIKEALSKLLNENVELIKAKKECVAIYLRCKSFESLKHLWTSCVNGEITQMFKPVEQCLREMPGCENVELEVILTEDEVLRCVEKMGHQIKSSVTMATMLPTLYKPGYRNWVKGCTALKFARDGIANFVDRNIHQFHQDVLANILSDSQCSSCTMENIMPCKYDSNFCRYSEQNCKTHDPNDPMKTSRPCPNSVCNKIRNEIERKHRLHDPSWRNTDSSRWCDEPWQLATCYMPVGYAASTSASQTDLAGLLSIITNNTVFDTVVEDNLAIERNLFYKAREVRNNILHMEDMRITDTELADYIQTLQTMLSNPKCSTTDPDIQNAKTRLTEIQYSSLLLRNKDEKEIRADALRAIDDEQQDALSAVTTQNYKSVAAVKNAKVEAEGDVDSKQRDDDKAAYDVLRETKKVVEGKKREALLDNSFQHLSSVAAVNKAKVETEDAVEGEQHFAEMSKKQITKDACRETQTVFDEKTLELLSYAKAKYVKLVNKAGIEIVGNDEMSIKTKREALKQKLIQIYRARHLNTELIPSNADIDVKIAETYVQPHMQIKRVNTRDMEVEQNIAEMAKKQIAKNACHETQTVFDENNWERLPQEVDSIKAATSQEDKSVKDVNKAGIEIVGNDEMSIKTKRKVAGMEPPWDQVYARDVPPDFDKMRKREDRKERIKPFWDLLVTDKEPKVNKESLVGLVHDLKEEGNTLFKEALFDIAWMHYRNAIFVVKILENRFYHTIEKEFTSSLFSNRAFCCLKKSMYKEAAQDCESAIGVYPKNFKAYYRQALAYKHMKNYKEAYKSACKGQDIQPSSALKELLDELEIHVKPSSKAPGSNIPRVAEASAKSATTVTIGNQQPVPDDDWLSGTNIKVTEKHLETKSKLPTKKSKKKSKSAVPLKMSEELYRDDEEEEESDEMNNSLGVEDDHEFANMFKGKSDKGCLYKPKSKLVDLASTFQSVKSFNDDKPALSKASLKKKTDEKKKSNLGMFNEERIQEERHILKRVIRSDGDPGGGGHSPPSMEEERMVKKSRFESEIDLMPEQSDTGYFDDIDPRIVNAYIDALKDGKEKTNTIRIMLVGNAGVGKSSLTNNLLGMFPGRKIDRTDGIEVHRYKCNDSCDLSTKDVPSDGKTAQRIAMSSNAMQPSDAMQPKEKPIEHLDMNTLHIVHQSNPKPNKQMKLGEPSKDKTAVSQTSLFESLQINDEQLLTIPTLTIPTDILKINETEKQMIRRFSSKTNEGHLTNETSIHIWDFGGQFVYYATHQLFHSQRAVYLLVLDASADLNDIMETCELTNASGDKDVKYFCKFWMNSIHSFVGNDKNEPPVILVATKTDLKPGWNEEKQNALFESVRNLFDGSPVGYHIQPKCFAVNNFSEDIADFINLRKYIEEVAKSQESWSSSNSEVPARWIPLEDSLSKLTAEKHITLQQIMTIGSELNVPINDELQIKAFLVYQHALGNLVYFDDDDLSDSAVLDPQWIIDAFKTIITPKAKQYCLENQPLRKQWEQLTNEAILSKELIKAVWNIDNENQFSRNEAILLKYLIKFGIICEINELDLDKNIKEHKDYLFVPSLLNAKLSQLNLEQLLEARTVTQTALVFAFEDNYVPQMLHHSLTAAALGKWNVLVFRDQRMLAENIGVYELDEVHAGLIEVCDTSIEIRVVNLCGENINSVQTDKLRRFVRLKIDAEFQRFSKTRLSPYTLGIRCYFNKKKGTKTIELNTLETMRYDRVPCPDNHPGHFINKADIMNQWVCSPKSNANDKDGIINQFTRYCKRDLTFPVTDKEMVKVAGALGLNWELLGIELGLSTLNIDQIKMDNPYTSVNQIFKMLKMWAEKEAKNASMEKLLVAINGAVRINVDWDKIKNMLEV